MIRSGLSNKILKLGWTPVVVAETAKFNRSLKLFDKFDIVSEVIGWDETATLIKQTFLKDDVVMCEAVVRGIFVKRNRRLVKISELIKIAAVDEKSATLEPWIADWNNKMKAGL